MPRVSTEMTAAAPALALQLAPADMVGTARFDASRKQQVAVIAASVAGSNTVATFGAGPQRKLSGFLDQLLAGVRAEEIGTAGTLVAELATGIKMLDLPGVKREVEGRAGLLARLPIIGRTMSALRRFRAMQGQMVDHMAATERKAELHLGKLKANAGLDRLLDATEANLRELEVWVAAGQQILMRMRDAFEAERLALSTNHDAAGLARLRDMAEQANAFEARLVRMHAAFAHGVLAIPQIRMARQAGRTEMQDTLDALLSGLPGLKAAIARVAALHPISRAGIQAKTVQGDVDALSRATDKMLATVDKASQIDRDDQAKRETAVQQLGEVRERLMESLRTQAGQTMRG